MAAGWPGSAGARAQIHDAVRATLVQVFWKQWRDRVIGVRDFQNHLEAVDELVPQELREPWLFVDFKKS
jgi:hypothetical protein